MRPIHLVKSLRPWREQSVLPMEGWRTVLILSGALLALAGCASLPPDEIVQRRLAAPAGSLQRECLAFFARLDDAIASHGVVDSDAAAIAGFPYLRADRLLASFAHEPLAGPAWESWIDRMQALNEAGWRVEITNLPAAERAKLQASLPDQPASLEPADAVHACADALRATDLGSAAGRSALQSAVEVPDDYRTWQRAVGLYPLTSVAFALGAQRLQRETQATFDRDLAELPVRGRLIRYAPAASSPTRSAQEIAAQFKLDRRGDGPQMLAATPDAAALDEVFGQFAPVFEIDTAADEDRIGALGWQAASASRPLAAGGVTDMADGATELGVDIAVPTVYRYLTHARFGGDLLPQLNYTIWFPAREREGRFDLLGGHLDGITFRVTLGADGDVLAADAVHNCGCYHLFFPSSRIRLKPQPATLEETAFAPQALPEIAAGERLTIRIAQHTHFIERVRVSSPNTGDDDAVRYAQTDYDALRTLPLSAGGSRSAFGADGIVPGTERRERYFYWPMGVPNAGAMRGRGHHATAFVGRRYFDDPWLFETGFESVR